MENHASATPVSVYGVFAGEIHQATVGCFMEQLSLVASAGVKHAHLLFHSAGGRVEDGIALYNFFRALPIGLTLYNPGLVGSIAVVAFLGAPKRKTSAHALFALHRSYESVTGANAARLKNIAEAVSMDDVRTETILREHTRIPAERWSLLDHNDLYFTAKEAVEYGIADGVEEFSPPAGVPLLNIHA